MTSVEEQDIKSEESTPLVEPAEPDAVVEPVETRGRGVEWAVLVIAALILAAGLVSWLKAGDHDAKAVELAELRDTVLISARANIETMNTLDYRDVPGGLEKWQDVSTGTLKDQIAGTDEETRALMKDQGKVSSGKVVDAAVIDLTPSTATVIASVEVTVRDGADPDAAPTVKRNRFAADLVKVGGTWLLETLDQVAVDLS
ncbi:hypothetical protein [Nocardioides sp. WS12]|uniref:hypothetical protein n=1 Tax=Nocardioides sp. WS12 TaxID=2486272 RepID=UPI0015FA65E1|nr:hypothetical protein [Nocardioides sp. WS12]